MENNNKRNKSPWHLLFRDLTLVGSAIAAIIMVTGLVGKYYTERQNVRILREDLNRITAANDKVHTAITDNLKEASRDRQQTRERVIKNEVKIDKLQDEVRSLWSRRRQ